MVLDVATLDIGDVLLEVSREQLATAMVGMSSITTIVVPSD
jgi:hypothetical protein